MSRKLLLFIALSLSFFAKSQTLYWVGGSGNINDGHHWSYTSGGTAVGVSPSPNTDVIFDDNSSSNELVIDITGLLYVKSIKFNQTKNDYYFRGSNLSTLNCGGDFILNEKTFFEANTKLVFASNSSTYHVINVWKNVLKSNVLFEEGNWDLQSLKISDNDQLKINKGNYKLNNASVVAGDFESASDNVVFHSVHSVLHVKNRIILGDKVSFNSNDLIVIAQKNNPLLYRISSGVNFGTNHKVYSTNPNPQACSITYSFTNPSCNGSCDASITIGFDAACTTGPYDILFNNGSGCFPSGANGVMPPTFSLNSLCSCGGLLDILVFDSNGFVTQLTQKSTPQAPTPLGLIFSGLKQPRCFGDCDGSLSIFPTGGSSPYNISVISATTGSTVATYSNIPFVTTTTVSGLCAGTYSFVVVDNNNCSKTFTTTMTQPALINPHGASTDVTCNGVCNGSATVTPTGGVGPYTYSWLSPSSIPATSTSTTISNLCPGIVTMTVTDSKTCTAVYNANITQPPAITLTVTKTDLNCGSICNGTASVTATGGLGAFLYSWTPSGGSGAAASGLCAGNYTCTVTNNGNCVKTITVDILSPPTLTASPTQSNILCNAVCNGSVNLHPSGGTPSFTYNWTPAVSSGSVATNLCAGAYVYTITDFLGCQFTNTITITQPPALTLTIANTSITCNGACDGTATGNPSGGAGSYTYSWSPGNPSGQNTSAITNLCPGTFTLKVTDSNLCTITNTVSITQPIPITTNATFVSPTCNGLCNGSINSNPSGGTAPYTFTLQSSSGSITSNPPYTNLCADIYTLTVKDFRGCVKNQVINLTQPNPIILTLNTTPINCFNQCNATISTVVNGGTPLYTFTWSAGGTGTSLTNQCVGVHTATVTDANGCKGIGTATVTSPPDLIVSITPTNPNCNAQCTGIATASVSGGTPNYNINWNNGNSGNIISGLCQGTYTATVSDFFGCTKVQTVTIVTPPAMTLTATNATVSCSGSCDGIVSVTPTGGTSGYFYSWNSVPTQTTASASGLCVGNYVASVTDSKGCIASVAANVTQPAVLTASISNVQPSCNVCIGAATANGIGGTGPYTYSWSPGGQNTQTASNLCVGVQTVIVTDVKNCTSTQTVQINQTVIILATTNGSTLTCNGVCSGIATANPSGGVGPYNYTWTPAPIQNTQTATNLCAGSHTVIVSDANGCSNTSVVSFVNPPAITLTVNQTNVTCNGLCNGVASANASGGTGAISYQWQPGGATTSSINGLCPGDYTVTVTDANNCSQTQIVTITQVNSLTASFTFTNPTTCTSSNGAINATISGGTPTYTISWLPGGSSANPLINLVAGTYSLNVMDAAGCTQTIVTTLNNPTGPTVTVTSNSISCFGSCTGSATLSISGSGPFSVNWPAPVSSTNTAVAGLCAGLYIPVVTDVNNCVTNQTVNIVQPTQLTASGLVTNATCNSACTASINLSPSGGTLPYTYTWSPSGGPGQDPINLCVGSYSVDIADANGCLTTNSFIVTQPATLTLSFNKKDVLCNGNCTGGARAIVGGGTGPYTYTWTPSGSFGGANIDTLVNLCSGDYTVIAMDANGCSISGIVNIGQPTVFTSTITSVNMKCNGQCNGSAIINASGGMSPYSYNYNTTPVTPTQTIGGLCVGTYTGNAIDANGCISSNNFNITEPLPIIVTTTISNPKCNAVCNGSVATSVTGGNSNYTYNWLPNGGPVPNPTGLCAGNYTVVVTDDSLCTGQALVVLTDPAALIANISFTNPTCNLGCNGIVTSNPIGGTAPFSYSWLAPLNLNQTVTNLCAGSYTLTLTDANLCQNVQVATLINPPAITLNPAITPATCGFNDGSINATAASGIAPYTYNWLAPVPGAQATNSLVINLGAGIYTVIVTDAASCSATVAIPLSNSNGPSGATITSTNVTCHGLCNGSADISSPVAGGTSPYTLSWVTPVSASTTITNLCAGSYTAQIEDANNCLFFQSIVIAEPQLIDDNENIISAACSGNCNGSISVNPTGGNGTYTYAWSNTAITQSVSGLCPGLISIVITDNLNCTYATTYTVPSITTITSSTFATNNTCFGNCNGTLLATNVAGGLPPYSFGWNDPIGQASASAIGLCNGTYSVTITDANGCFNTLPATVTSPAQITFTPTITEPSCDLCNGSAIINPVGGVPGYTYLWSVNNQTGNTATNLCAGVYMVQIVDGNGCQSNSNVIINSSSSITGETVAFADVSCSGACDGTVSVTAIGGAGPISYHWVHNGSSSQSLIGLCAGTYFCNMTDINGCSRTASVVIGATTAFTITPQVSQSSCTASTGSITVNVSGGTGTYTYAWLPAGSTATLTNLAPGIYTLTVSDGNCSQTQVYAINSINGPLITFTKKDVSCTGICDGKISLTISAGTPGYTTQWSNGLGTPVVSGLCAGAYSVMVTDAAGCQAVKNFSLNTITPVVFSTPDLDNPTCTNNCNGSLTTIPIGGTLPYTYSWTPSEPSTPTINGLCAGGYSVTVSDANACPVSESYSLTNPPTLTMTAAITDASCNTVADGAIDITVSGGVFPYTYTWTPGPINTEDISNLSIGNYTINLTDNFGCTIDSSFRINSLLTVNALAGNDTLFCQNGTLQLNGSNSNGGINYQWIELPSNTVVSNTLITTVNPATGTSTYVLVATNGACIDRDSITVTSLALPNVDAGPMVSIPLLSSATIGGNPTGPTGSTYSWTPFTSLDNPVGSNPTSGTTVTTVYTVTVVDGNGCSNWDTVTVLVYPEIMIPNGFSPNADGKNDVWQIDFIYQFPDCEVEVYNRWGERLFYSKGYAVPFNGQYKGKDLPVGTYYYIINLNHPAYPNAYTSPLTIFR